MDLNQVWQSLGISNDFIFGKVMRDPDLCREMLERILDVKIVRLEYPEAQKAIDLTLDARSIRLDIYVEDDADTVYNVEIQTADTGSLAKRSRYYQGMIDLNLIDKGELYNKLKRSYVIFLCTFDLFGQGRHKYTFEYLCREDPTLALGDETTKIFLNASSDQNDVTPALRAFLDYVVGKPSADPFVQTLEQTVHRVKTNEDWRREFMTLQLRDHENVEKGRAEGEARKERSIIQTSLNNGMTPDQIIHFLGLPPDIVRKTAKEIGYDC